MTNLLCSFCMWRIFPIWFPCTFRWSIWPYKFHYCNFFLLIINQTKILAAINYNSKYISQILKNILDIQISLIFKNRLDI